MFWQIGDITCIHVKAPLPHGMCCELSQGIRRGHEIHVSSELRASSEEALKIALDVMQRRPDPQQVSARQRCRQATSTTSRVALYFWSDVYVQDQMSLPQRLSQLLVRVVQLRALHSPKTISSTPVVAATARFPSHVACVRSLLPPKRFCLPTDYQSWQTVPALLMTNGH